MLMIVLVYNFLPYRYECTISTIIKTIEPAKTHVYLEISFHCDPAPDLPKASWWWPFHLLLVSL